MELSVIKSLQSAFETCVTAVKGSWRNGMRHGRAQVITPSLSTSTAHARAVIFF
jgi:hypothetical protein